LTYILAIDTSSAWCSVALSIGDKAPSFRHESTSTGASHFLLPWIDDLLSKANVSLSRLDAIAIGIGPGAFTGVRLGLAVVQGLAIGAQVPVIPVASLDAIALQLTKTPRFKSSQAENFIIALDARMDEIYWARFEMLNHSAPVRIGEIQLSKPEELNLSNCQFLAGSAIKEYGELLFMNGNYHLAPEYLDDEISISALGILEVAKMDLSKGKQISVSQLEPLYIRNKVALTTTERMAISEARFFPHD
jgi:tRNA threonylcarbamoyladenosine biosynthesis protein TsaB